MLKLSVTSLATTFRAWWALRLTRLSGSKSRCGRTSQSGRKKGPFWSNAVSNKSCKSRTNRCGWNSKSRCMSRWSNICVMALVLQRQLLMWISLSLTPPSLLWLFVSRTSLQLNARSKMAVRKTLADKLKINRTRLANCSARTKNWLCLSKT